MAKLDRRMSDITNVGVGTHTHCSEIARHVPPASSAIVALVRAHKPLFLMLVVRLSGWKPTDNPCDTTPELGQHCHIKRAMHG
jgi:hypothetical protein